MARESNKIESQHKISSSGGQAGNETKWNPYAISSWSCSHRRGVQVQRDRAGRRMGCEASYAVKASQAVVHVGHIPDLEVRQLGLLEIRTWREGLEEAGETRRFGRSRASAWGIQG